MTVLHSIDALSTVPGPVVAAIGVFDGVHLGHQAVIGRALADARAMGGSVVVVSFNPHPARVLRPERAPYLLTSTPHKIRLLHALGVPYLLIIEFTREFADLPPEDFLDALHRACRPLREICVGHQWCFGRDRRGTLEFIGQVGDRLGFEEVGVPAVMVEGEVISSTLIRGMIKSGELERAARFLGREFTILGTVIEGDHLGAQLGFPTANLSTHNEQFPPDGVYAVEAWLGDDRARRFGGVVNIGVRPTVKAQGGERLLECHLFDFHDSIYGQEIEVAFRQHLRPEQKFANLDALRAQIAADAAQAREILRVPSA